MKIIRKAVFQMTPDGYELLSEDSFDHQGVISEAKGASGSPTIDPATMGMLTKQSADLNRTNTSGTYGKSEWNIDPTTGRYTQNVSLDPSQQSQLDSRNQIAEQMLGSAKKNLGNVTGPFNYSSGVSDPARASFDSAAQRLKPQFDQQDRNFDQHMSDTGIPMGGEAYNKSEQQLAQGQSDALQGAAQGSANTQNSMDVSERQQRYSDIANMLGTQNTAQPTTGTQAAIDTTGNFDKLNQGVNSMFNNANSKQAGATQAGLALLAAFL